MAQSRFDDFQRALDDRTASNRYRKPRNLQVDGDPAYVLLDGKRLINACSNDYLNLSRHPEVIESANDACKRFGAGSTASRLVSGSRDVHSEFEADLALHVQRERSILFSSGYLANGSLISALVGKDDHIFIDRLAHNSLYQGAILSGATLHRFRHNDLHHLSKLMGDSSSSTGKKLVVTEAIFSMDGDSPDLGLLCTIADEHDAILYVDEAHSFGLKGEAGQGMVAAFPRVDIIGTMFGKAMGGSGGCIACNGVVAEYLINHAGGYIYTTAPPPQVVGGLSASLRLIKDMDQEREHIASVSNALRDGLRDIGYDVLAGDSPIIPVRIGSEEDTLSLSMHLQKQGILAGAIRPPTVPTGGSRIRMTLTAAHTYSHVEQIVEAFRKWNGLSV